MNETSRDRQPYPFQKWDGLIFFYQRWVRLWFDITVLIIEYASELYLGKKKRLYIHTIPSHPITEKKNNQIWLTIIIPLQIE